MTCWTWAAAAATGTSHRRTGTKRQDHFRAVAAEGGVLIAIACDGAGSAPLGGEGAALASRVISQAIREALGGEGLSLQEQHFWDALDSTRDLLAAVSERRMSALRDLATTVVMAVSDGQQTWTLHIGDGAIVARDTATAEWVTLSWPEHGEYASTTFFITDDGELSARLQRHDRAIDRLALFTDGIERLALDFSAQIPHPPFFAGMTHPLASEARPGRNHALSDKLRDFLDGDAVNDRTDDDKTLILAVRQ